MNIEAIIYDAISKIECNKKNKDRILFVILKFFRINRKQLPERIDNLYKGKNKIN